MKANNMTEGFIQKRLTELRLKKGVSEYKMSIDMGHSKGYIQSITSGRSLPSLSEFIYMCEYLEVTPQEFFDDKCNEPILVNKLISIVSSLPDKDILALINIATCLYDKESDLISLKNK